MSEETPEPEMDDVIDTERVLVVAERLEKHIPGLQQDIADLKRLGKGNRRRIKWIAAGGAVQTVLFLLFVLTYARADHAYEKAVTVQEYTKNACASGNEFRATNRELWAGIADEIRRFGPNSKKFADRVESRAKQKFQPRDCSAVTRQPEPTGTVVPGGTVAPTK